jgi:hypothetical protein
VESDAGVVGVADDAVGVETGWLGSGTLGARAVDGVAVSTGLASVEAGAAVVVSILKSAAVGGGTLAGSGSGIAASIASSAALLRG